MIPTLEEIENYIRNLMADAPLRPNQKAVCAPRILQNIERLHKGEKPPHIKVFEGVIIEGHHRFIAGMMFGELPLIDPGILSVNNNLQWSSLNVDNEMWNFENETMH